MDKPGEKGGEGGTGGEDKGGEGGAGGEGASGVKDQTVSKAEFDKVLNELHGFKSKAKEAEKKLTELENNKLKEQNQWKELAEKHEKEANEAKANSDKLHSSFMNEKKFTAVQAAATKLGLRPEAISDLEMLDLSEIQIETTSTGRFNVLGADKYAEKIKGAKPHWFSDKTPPAVDTSGRRVIDTGGAVTTAMLRTAEVEGRKKGDLSEYYSLFNKYQEQRKALRLNR